MSEITTIGKESIKQTLYRGVMFALMTGFSEDEIRRYTDEAIVVFSDLKHQVTWEFAPDTPIGVDQSGNIRFWKERQVLERESVLLTTTAKNGIKTYAKIVNGTVMILGNKPE